MPWKPVDPAASIHERRRRQAAHAIRPRGYGLPYKSKTWSHLRSVKLSVHPICEVCEASVAREVHHLNSDPWDNRWENLLSACKPCHSAATITERGIHGRRAKGPDAFGVHAHRCC